MRWAIACLVLAATLASCSTDVSDIAMTEDFTFEPATATVEAGATLTFVNDSEQPHTVTAYEDGVPDGGYFSSGGFDSEEAAREGIADALIEPGGSFEVTLEQPGTYRYFCIPHESQNMKGTVRVE